MLMIFSEPREFLETNLMNNSFPMKLLMPLQKRVQREIKIFLWRRVVRREKYQKNSLVIILQQALKLNTIILSDIILNHDNIGLFEETHKEAIPLKDTNEKVVKKYGSSGKASKKSAGNILSDKYEKFYLEFHEENYVQHFAIFFHYYRFDAAVNDNVAPGS